ncbi:MAG TPA: sulfite exporter TauE/SafE family protein, partial [Patescibacteria group bacterium]|nr:sulfite exporter TauE/SafE family protein [Patescibacteria group bacterium]
MFSLTIAIIAGIGILIGLLSGLFGIGGALIATPLLKVFAGLPPLLALASPLPAAIPSAISGSIVYHRNRLIDFTIAKVILLCAIPLNYIGVEATKYVDGQILMILTGAFLLMVGCTFFIRGWMLKEEKTYEVQRSLKVLIPAGIATGFLSGLLAIGGGIVLV